MFLERQKKPERKEKGEDKYLNVCTGCFGLIRTFSVRCLMQPQAIAQGGKGDNLKSRRGERQAGEKGDVSLLLRSGAARPGPCLTCLVPQSWGQTRSPKSGEGKTWVPRLTKQSFHRELSPVKTVGLDRTISEDLFCSTFCNSAGKTF